MAKREAYSRERIYRAIRSLGTLQDKAFVAMLFLTAARIGELLAVTKKDIRYERYRDEKGREIEVMIVRMPIEKRKKAVEKYIPIPSLDPLYPLVKGYVERVREGKVKTKGGKLFPFTRKTGWAKCKGVGFIPHNLRHSRLTEVSYYMPSGEMLSRFAGWKLKGAAEYYIHIEWRPLTKPLIKAAEDAPPFE